MAETIKSKVKTKKNEIAFWMKLLDYFGLFWLIGWATGASSVQGDFSVEISEKYSFVEVGLAVSWEDGPLSVEIASSNLEVFQIQKPSLIFKQACPETKRAFPENIYGFNPHSPQTCLFAPHSFARFISFGFFTHFYEKDSVQISGMINQKPFEQDQILTDIVPREIAYLFRPVSIEEGKAIFPAFGIEHLKRGHGFRRAPLKSQMSFGSIPRSGTHALLHSIEEITGEFIRTFPAKGYDLEDPNVLTGEIKATLKVMTFGFVSHHLRSDFHPISLITRQIMLVRNPAVSADSHFHLFATKLNHTCKIQGDYMKNKHYIDFILWRTNLARSHLEERKHLASSQNIPTGFFRYEDLLANPIQVLMAILSFYTGTPSEISFSKKTKELIEKKGLTSFYRKEAQATPVNQTHYRKPEIQKVDKFPLWMLRAIYTNNSNIIEDFGYSEVFEEVPALNVTIKARKEDGLLPFELHNKETLEMMLTYRFDYSKMKHNLKEYPVFRTIEEISKRLSYFFHKFYKHFDDYPRKCTGEKG